MLSQDTQTIDYSKPNIEKLNKEKRQRRIFFLIYLVLTFNKYLSFNKNSKLLTIMGVYDPPEDVSIMTLLSVIQWLKIVERDGIVS